MTRRRGYPSITQDDTGWWHAWVTVGVKPTNGRPDQRHVKRRTYEEVEERVDELLAQRKTGAVVKAGRPPTVQQWMTTYLDTIAPRRCDPSTIYDYRSKCTHWVYPVCGTTRMDRLRPDQLDEVYLRMQRAGRADSSILKTHRILTRALEVAYRRGIVPRNVATLIDAPTARRPEMRPLTLTEAHAVLDVAARRRNGARWSVGLALGLRQGEAIGLRWEYVDLAAAEARIWWQLRRRTYLHGCSQSGALPSCGRRKGGYCPDRLQQRGPRDVDLVPGDALVLKEPKGKSKRVVPLPRPLVERLEAHHEMQSMEKSMAGGLYSDYDLTFATELGAPVSPERDYDDWRGLLREAGVRDARVHDGRHTAGTLLTAQGVDIRTVQEILGHADVRTTQGYTHVASAMARDATDRIGWALLDGGNTP